MRFNCRRVWIALWALAPEHPLRQTIRLKHIERQNCPATFVRGKPRNIANHASRNVFKWVTAFRAKDRLAPTIGALTRFLAFRRAFTEGVSDNRECALYIDLFRCLKAFFRTFAMQTNSNSIFEHKT